ncbi:MAG: carboxymuconolactone decarboxylase family protein [Steroidobacteraceae bacterium]
MTPRLDDPAALAPQSIEALVALEKSFKSSGLDFRLLELVKLRASQINGCVFCMDMHVSLLTAQGEKAVRLHHLPAWRESPLFTERERAALGWCEALTRLAETGAPDADYAALEPHFTPQQQVSLTLAIGAINVWNRLKVGFRAAPATVTVAA